MAEAVYVLCAVACLLCAILLLRSYVRSRLALILWTSLCFVGLAANNLLLVVDLAVVRDVDFMPWRGATQAGAMAVLLYGLITTDVSWRG